MKAPKIIGKVTLASGREHSVKRFHPWIFSGAIQAISGSPNTGDWVEVTASHGEVLGYGHYHNASIAVRMITFDAVSPTENLWIDKLSLARQIRALGFLSNDTNAYRLVHAEGDGLPGLIIDVYHGVAVIQAHSQGMTNDRHAIAHALQQVMPNEISTIYYKSTQPNDKSEYLLGTGGVPQVILEHGLKFLVDWEEGQKTGFFLDQRENRALLGKYVHDKTVLNTFCYTGGFSVYALAYGARTVHSVDTSNRAVALTKKNIELNGFDAHVNPCVVNDVFDYMKMTNEKFDVIVLDPPAFAKHLKSRHQAMKGYQRLNAEAMRIIKSGGILFTFSCSQVVSSQLFYDTIVSAAIQADRHIKVLHQVSQPPDHPVSIFHPEGQYLKGLVMYVS